MIHLSESEKLQARTASLTVLTENANKALADRTATKSGEIKAISALMAVEWKPATVRPIGSQALNRLLHLIRSDIFSGEEYRTFADMTTRATDPFRSLLRGQWELWKSAIARFHLYEIADQQDWEGLIAQFGDRGILPPIHLYRVPSAELIKADWSLPNPDMLIWIWQAARGDSCPNRANPLPPAYP